MLGFVIIQFQFSTQFVRHDLTKKQVVPAFTLLTGLTPFYPSLPGDTHDVILEVTLDDVMEIPSLVNLPSSTSVPESQSASPIWMAVASDPDLSDVMTFSMTVTPAWGPFSIDTSSKSVTGSNVVHLSGLN